MKYERECTVTVKIPLKLKKAIDIQRIKEESTLAGIVQKALESYLAGTKKQAN